LPQAPAPPMRGGRSHLSPVAAPLGRPAWRGERPEQRRGRPRVRVLVAALGGLALSPARCSSPHRTSGLGPRWGAAVSPSVAITVIGRARQAHLYPRARRGGPARPGRLAAPPMGPQTTHRPAGMRARARSIAVFTLVSIVLSTLAAQPSKLCYTAKWRVNPVAAFFSS